MSENSLIEEMNYAAVNSVNLISLVIILNGLTATFEPTGISLVRKRRLKLTARIPNYMADTVAWKEAIYAAVTKAQHRAGVRYSKTDKLEVEVCFHLQGHRLTKLDLDNRLKQVGDALQGFINDKGAGGLKPIIPDDNQIYRLTAEKRLPSKRDRKAPSVITIRRYDRHVPTVRDPRETRKHL